MDSDDIAYGLLLGSSLSFGYFYNKIKDKQLKKWIGSLAGIAMLLLVMGICICYSLLMFLVNCFIILWLPKRYCHLVSFTYTFIHLFFTRITTSTYFNNPFLPYHTTVIEMMMTLKLVGLAFDVNCGYLLKKKLKTNEETSAELEKDFIKPNCIEIFHYTFSFIGIIGGPYYRYKTFIDFFDLPFSVSVPKNKQVIRKVMRVVLCFSLLILVSSIWPISYAFSEEFYVKRSWLYRLWYSWIIFLNFRFRVYAGTAFTESICIITGLGAYPSITEPRSGYGPTIAFRQMKEIAGKSASELVEEEYSFETIHSMNPYVSEFCTTTREAMKNWNMCIQYWLVVTVYKRFPYKKLRASATMFVSALWHGIYTGYYICIASVPFYFPVEDLYVELFLKGNKGKSLKMWQWIIWFSKMMSLGYLSVAFHLLEIEKCIYYYKSTYFCVFITWVVLYIIGKIIKRTRNEKFQQNDYLQK